MKTLVRRIGPSPPSEPRALVGPNAIVQTSAALQDRVGDASVQAVFGEAGLDHYLDEPPSQMIPQDEAARLFAAVRALLPADEADAVLGSAGRRTARYVVEHRIPPGVKRLLAILPASVGARLLLSAIGKHAWTFAGSGPVGVRGWPDCELEIEANPLATPGCPWHVATFHEMFRVLVSPRVHVRHAKCCARGDRVCHFEIALRTPGG